MSARRRSKRAKLSTRNDSEGNDEIPPVAVGSGNGASGNNAATLEVRDGGNDLPNSSAYSMRNRKGNKRSQLDRELNPMMNPVILKHFFDFLPPHQLVVCRQVCKLWQDISLDRWRTQTVIRATVRHRKTTDEEGIPVYFDSRGRPRPIPKSQLDEFRDVTVAELLRHMNNPFYKMNIKPYRNFDMRGMQSPDILKRKDPKMMKFWTIYGPTMHELRFGGFKFDSVEMFRDVFCRWTPNLQKLSLHLTAHEVPTGVCGPVLQKQTNLKILSVNFFANLYEENKFPLPWYDFLNTFPNLQELVLSFLYNFSEFNSVLEALERIRTNNRDHLKLKKLDISRVKREAVQEFPVRTARLLHDLRLPLERLDADIGYTTGVTSMKLVLQSHHKTLKHLTLFRAPFTGPFTNFPFNIQFDNLKVLELYGPFTWDFSFLRFTPNLEKLYVFLDANFISYLPIFMRIYRRNMEAKVDFLEDMVDLTRTRFDMDSVRLEKLETFLGEFEIKSPESIRTLARWMPNVRHLGLHLGKTTFPTVCELFPDLTCLCVYGHNDVDDEALTGVPVDCATGSRTSRRIGRQLVPEPRARPPNITNLTKLTSFTLSRPSNHPFDCAPLHRTPKLTDHAVTYGILCLPQLNYLSISMASFVSRKNYELLKKKLRQDCITLLVSRACSCAR